MNDNTITSIAQLAVLIKSVETLDTGSVKRKDDKNTVYAWMSGILMWLNYPKQRKRDKGITRKYLIMYSGYTETHIDHLTLRWKKNGCKLLRKERTQQQFERIYTPAYIALLADVALAYRHQNGMALREVCRSMFSEYDDLLFERMAKISVSHLYALKKTNIFVSRAGTYTKTKATTIPIGERKKPFPEGKPGYIRVDSVHQGDLDKEKGVYHVNLVDEVIQW